ncbi:AbrB/MazE/SpoVT family DNA-binding domain-containing protein [Methylomagnum sp.]
MKTQLVTVGGSKCVVIPAPLLSRSGLGDEVIMTAEAGRIVITPAVSERQGWFDGYQADADEDAFAGLAATDADSEEWEW